MEELKLEIKQENNPLTKANWCISIRVDDVLDKVVLKRNILNSNIIANQTLSVNQWSYWVLNNLSQERYIETVGLLSCIGVIVWDSNSKNVWIIHIDWKTDIKWGIYSMLREIGIEDKNSLQIDIIGGSAIWLYDFGEDLYIKNKIEKQLDIILRIFEDEKIPIRNYDVLENNPKLINKSIVIDRETWEVYDINYRSKIN